MKKKSTHKWQFKARFRSGAYSWKGTALASKRLKEAVSEIKKVAKSDPALAAEGVVGLMERLWPSLEHIDTSSGAMGNAVYGTLQKLIPILINAPLDLKTRKKLLERLYKAIEDDGVDYLSPVEDRWGEICVFPELLNHYADDLFPWLRKHFANRTPGSFFSGTVICLSSLLEAGRYDELKELILTRAFPFWHYDKYWAIALERQDLIDEAISFAESNNKENYGSGGVARFCEDALLKAGRVDEAYEKYAFITKSGMTYLAQFRSIVKKYPHKEPREILTDLIQYSGNKGSWFASARQMGYLDIALDCALTSQVDPKTLIRAAKDKVEKEPEFSMQVAFRAIDLILQGRGYDLTTFHMHEAYKYLMAASERVESTEKVRKELENMLNRVPPNYDKVSQGVLENLLSQWKL